MSVFGLIDLIESNGYCEHNLAALREEEAVSFKELPICNHLKQKFSNHTCTQLWMVWFFYSRRSWHMAIGMSWTQLISHLKIGNFNNIVIAFLPGLASGWVMKNTLFWVIKSTLFWVIKNTLFLVIKNTLFYFRLGYQKYPILGYEKYPILSQVGLWKIPNSI